MEKLGLTEEGIAKLASLLYAMTDAELSAEAMALASDPLGYIALKFSLPVHQLEHLRAADANGSAIVGLILAAGLLARIPIRFRELDASAKSSGSFRLESAFSLHISDTVDTSGAIEITLTI